MANPWEISHLMHILEKRKIENLSTVEVKNIKI